MSLKVPTPTNQFAFRFTTLDNSANSYAVCKNVVSKIWLQVNLSTSYRAFFSSSSSSSYPTFSSSPPHRPQVFSIAFLSVALPRLMSPLALLLFSCPSVAHSSISTLFARRIRAIWELISAYTSRSMRGITHAYTRALQGNTVDYSAVCQIDLLTSTVPYYVTTITYYI